MTGTGSSPDVRFSRPDPARIRAEGFCPADMHFHTVHTDGMVGIPELLHTLRRTGTGCAVTDHNEISGALAACREREDLLVIPGIEISAADGPHILLYFYDPADLEDFFVHHIQLKRRESPWLLTTMTSSSVLEAAEGYSCLRVPAHPYGYFIFNRGLAKCVEKGYIRESLYKKCDGIEGICANMGRRENERALALAGRLGLPVTGGSDGHLLRDLGSAVTCTSSADPGEFLDELRKGRARVFGMENRLPAKILTAAAISARFMPWLLPSARVHCGRMADGMNRYMAKRRNRKTGRDDE